jgi:hypothetical protein
MLQAARQQAGSAKKARSSRMSRNFDEKRLALFFDIVVMEFPFTTFACFTVCVFLPALPGLDRTV